MARTTKVKQRQKSLTRQDEQLSKPDKRFSGEMRIIVTRGTPKPLLDEMEDEETTLLPYAPPTYH